MRLPLAYLYGGGTTVRLKKIEYSKIIFQCRLHLKLERDRLVCSNMLAIRSNLLLNVISRTSVLDFWFVLQPRWQKLYIIVIFWSSQKCKFLRTL